MNVLRYKHIFMQESRYCFLLNLIFLQGGEDWKRKLVQAPNHFEGSFVDADMQKFRPEPNVNPAEDPWFAR